jgi:hypothetical protein
MSSSTLTAGLFGLIMRTGTQVRTEDDVFLAFFRHPSPRHRDHQSGLPNCDPFVA